MSYLIYKHNGFIAGVPARDMEYSEASQYDIQALVKSGLYEIEEQDNNFDLLIEELEDKPKRKRRKENE